LAWTLLGVLVGLVVFSTLMDISGNAVVLGQSDHPFCMHDDYRGD